MVKLVHRERYVLASSSGVLSPPQVFRGNSPFDPDATGIGNSATGFALYAAQYNYYRCYGSKIVAKFCSLGTTPFTGVLQIGLAATPQVPTYTDMNAIAGHPYGRTRLFNTVVSLPTLKMYMSTAKMEGVHKKAVATDDTYAALVNANPAQPWYWSLWAQAADQASNASVVVYVTQTFYVEFYARVEVV